MLYLLKGREPVLESNPNRWLDWMLSVGFAGRRVGEKRIGPAFIATFFSGFNVTHDFISEAPRVFHTVVFGGMHDGLERSYTSWRDAEAGHQAVIAQVNEETPTEPVMAIRRPN